MTALILDQARLMSQLHYDPATGEFVNRITRTGRAPAGSVAGYMNMNGYLVIQVDRRKLLAHRMAWLYMTGAWPEFEIDHINRIRHDNRFENLRLATSADNKHNTSDRWNNTSGHRGVVWHKHTKKWQAQISANGQHHYLGQFAVIEDAIEARRKAVLEFHKFAVME